MAKPLTISTLKALPSTLQLALDMMTPEEVQALPDRLLRREIRPGDYLRMCGIQPFLDWCQERSPEFRWDWPHLLYIGDHLDLMTTGLLDRVMFQLPPRHGKSEIITIRYPVYRMELEAQQRVMTGSYNDDSAADFSRAARVIAKQRRGSSRGPGAGKDRENKVHKWSVPNGSSYLGGGVGSGFIGKGADILIVDDPVKNRAQAESLTYRNTVHKWYSDLYTRLEPGGQIAIVMHAWHQDDLCERVLREDKRKQWTVIRIPAIAMEGDPLGRAPGEALCPDRYPIEELERTRDTVDEITWMSNYQQCPISAKGSIFLREWWAGKNRYDWNDVAFKTNTVNRIISFDTAMKDKETSDYTVAVVMDLQNDYRCAVRYVERQKMGFPELSDFTMRQIADWRYRDGVYLSKVIIEDKASGTSLAQSLIGNLPSDMRGLVKAMPKRESKQSCHRSVTPYCRNGCVLLPHPGPEVPWLHDLEEELYAQPSAEHDDQADTFAQAVDWYKHLLQAGMDKRR